MLVHGAAKSGKSSLVVTGPAPRLILDIEASSRFLPINPIAWDPTTKPPEPDGTWDTAVVSTLSWQDAVNAKQWLTTGAHPFNSVIVDSSSELQQRYIVHTAGTSQLTQQNWGDVFRVVGGFIRDLRDLTMHPTKPVQFVGITAMTRQVDGMFKPWAQGQLQTVLPYLMDVTGYIWVEQVTEEGKPPQQVHKLLSRRTSQFEAGERVDGKLPAVITLQEREPGEPGTDIQTMIDRIFGGRSFPVIAPVAEPAAEEAS